MFDKVYEQSLNLMVKAAYFYYYSGLSQSEISERLNVSVPTVSRLIKKARDMRIVEFYIPGHYIDSYQMEAELRNRLGIKDVIISPCNSRLNDMSLEEIKKNVALEGARYIQRIITKDDTLGIAWGGTMYYLIHYLNPSQKIGASFVTLHGSIAEVADDLDSQSLVSRVSMAFGGKRYYFLSKALLDDSKITHQIWASDAGHRMRECFSRITVSVSGVGSLYPNLDSPLTKQNYLTKEMLTQLQDKQVCADLMLRFIDREGRECDTSLRDRTLSIPLNDYKRIPTKVIVAAGYHKADSILALLKGNLIDVLIIDYGLAKELDNRLGEGLV